jgi:hypothetical protein
MRFLIGAAKAGLVGELSGGVGGGVTGLSTVGPAAIAEWVISNPRITARTNLRIEFLPIGKRVSGK